MEAIMIAKVNWGMVALIVSLIIIFGGSIYALFAQTKRMNRKEKR